MAHAKSKSANAVVFIPVILNTYFFNFENMEDCLNCLNDYRDTMVLGRKYRKNEMHISIK